VLLLPAVDFGGTVCEHPVVQPPPQPPGAVQSKSIVSGSAASRTNTHPAFGDPTQFVAMLERRYICSHVSPSGTPPTGYVWTTLLHCVRNVVCTSKSSRSP